MGSFGETAAVGFGFGFEVLSFGAVFPIVVFSVIFFVLTAEAFALVIGPLNGPGVVALIKLSVLLVLALPAKLLRWPTSPLLARGASDETDALSFGFFTA